MVIYMGEKEHKIVNENENDREKESDRDRNWEI